MTVTTKELIDAVVTNLREAYPFPDRAEQAAHLLSRRLNETAYTDQVTPEVCEEISNDLFDACQDKHLRLLWHESQEEGADEAQLVAALRARILRENNGVRRVERLGGSVGLIELTIIPEASTGAVTLSAAMQLVTYTHALILDLRRALGGSPDGVAFLSSYLFPDGNTHLGDFIEGRELRQFWTFPYLPGPRYLDRPVFVLTGAATFSGGEALAYDLQAYRRATVFGAVTGGGAHPSETIAIAEHVELRLPVARPVNAVTGTNWEGSGVRPDVLVPESEALDAAYRTALEQILADRSTPDDIVIEAEASLAAQIAPSPLAGKTER
jgi:C-terminal processing protease CtpA/Prc